MKTWIAKVLGIGRVMLAWIWEIAREPVGDAIERLLPVALGIVAELAARSDLSGAEKRDVAVRRLSEAAKLEGVHVAASMVNLIVEMAVNQRKTG